MKDTDLNIDFGHVEGASQASSGEGVAEPTKGSEAFELDEMLEREPHDQTQPLFELGDTQNLFPSADETVLLDANGFDGEPIQKGTRLIAVDEEEAVTDASFMPKTPVNEETDLDSGKPRSRQVLITAIVLVIVCALVGAAVWYVYQQRLHEELMQLHPVSFTLDAPGYDMADSKIPFQIVGTDGEGGIVDEIGFVGPDGTGIELPSGTYTVRVASSPVLDDAQFYVVPDTQAEVIVPSDLEEGEQVQIESPAFVFMFANIVDVTDEQLALSYDYAVDSGYDPDRALSYQDALVEKRDALLAQEKAEEERQQRIEAATKALEEKAKERGTEGVATKLVDLNGDETPELLLAGNSSSAWGSMCIVYSYDAFSQTVLELCSATGGANHNPGIWYSSSKHEVVFPTAGPNTEMLTFYSIAPQEATLEYAYSHTWGLDPEDPENKGQIENFSLGSDAITSKSFQNMLDSLKKYSYLASPDS